MPQNRLSTGTVVLPHILCTSHLFPTAHNQLVNNEKKNKLTNTTKEFLRKKQTNLGFKGISGHVQITKRKPQVL